MENKNNDEYLRSLEWWETLSDEDKFLAYKNMQAANKSHADALHEIVTYLLGEGWYCMAMDIYSCNEEIVAAIKHNYRNVNYSWARTWERIKKELHRFFNNGK